MNKKQSLQHFLQENIENIDIQNILRAVSLSSIKIYKHLQEAFLKSNLIGSTNKKNIHGEKTKKLDIVANDIFIEELKNCKSCNIIISEELKLALQLDNTNNTNLLFALDPLDGSSNVDINGPLGSIFSIYDCPPIDNKLQNIPINGNQQVLAGYILYSSSAILALALSKGLYFFVLDPESREFLLLKENVMLPNQAQICSVNMGNYTKFTQNVKQNIDLYIENNYSFRYMSSMVADIHRLLITGGIFLYPGSILAPKLGKLRLLYECNPIAFIIDKAGGLSINGDINIMEVDVIDIHQKSAIITGNKEEALKFLR